MLQPNRATDFAVLVLLLCVTTGFLARKPTPLVPVSGKIYDVATRKPLTGVTVWRKEAKVYSDKNGAYSIQVPSGIRELTFRFAGRPDIRKSIISRTPAAPVRLDVLFPASPQNASLLTERSPGATREGKELQSDYPADSMLALSDAWGNDTRFLKLGLADMRAHSPVFRGPDEILFGVEGVVHRKDARKALGLFATNPRTQSIKQVAGGEPLLFADVLSVTHSVVAATGHSILIYDNPGGLLKNIHEEPRGSFILSVSWGPDGRIYFTVDEPVRLTATHSATRSRIASMKPDSTELKADWAAAPQYSFRYPIATGNQILYSRMKLDGTEQSLWIRSPEPRLILKDALRAVHYDAATGTIYYIFRRDLHFRDLKTGFDAIIQNSVDCGSVTPAPGRPESAALSRFTGERPRATSDLPNPD
jgi:hypothetical protein